MTREWFTTYCQNAAANVLNKDNEMRFSCSTLKAASDALAKNSTEGISNEIFKLFDNIINLCNTKHNKLLLMEATEFELMSVLVNMHISYAIMTGLWKDEPVPQQGGGLSECGFEIF